MKPFAFLIAMSFVAVPFLMLVMLWGDDDSDFVPVAMKLAVSCICLGVGSGGVFLMYKLMTAKSQVEPGRQQSGRMTKHRERQDARHQQSGKNYSCQHCGAGISTEAEISPSGDVKCPFCKSWFNINT